MTEETDKPQDEAVQAQEQPASAPTDDKEDSSPSAGEQQPENPQKGVQKRINELTAKVYQAEQQAAEERQARERLEQAIQGQQQQQPKAPHPDDYDNDGQYQEALNKYILEVATPVVREQVTQTANTLQAQANFQQKQADFVERANKAKQNFEDFDAVVGSIPPNVIDDTTYEVILGSPKGVELTYYLGSHLDEAIKLSQMPPVLRAAELARIEARLETPQPNKQTNAPDPIQPIQDIGGTQQKSLEDIKDINEWMKVRRAQLSGG